VGHAIEASNLALQVDIANISIVPYQKLLSTILKTNKEMDKLQAECNRWKNKAGELAKELEEYSARFKTES
jgi:hypothetical protein